MEMDEKQRWLISILPPPYNEWGISKSEFQFVTGWNSCRRTIMERAGLIKEEEERGKDEC